MACGAKRSFGVRWSRSSTPILHSGERYQFWTFRYASGDAIPYSAHQLRQSLRRARRTFDPEGTDAAFDRMVVVGHSLGGILAKMMVQESGSRLWRTVCEQPIDQLAGPAEDRRLLKQAFCYILCQKSGGSSSSQPRTAVVRSHQTPAGVIAKKLCDRPSRFLRALEIVQANNKPDLFTPLVIAGKPNERRRVGSRAPAPLRPLRSEDRSVSSLPFDHRGPAGPAEHERQRRDRSVLELTFGRRRL